MGIYYLLPAYFLTTWLLGIIVGIVKKSRKWFLLTTSTSLVTSRISIFIFILPQLLVSTWNETMASLASTKADLNLCRLVIFSQSDIFWCQFKITLSSDNPENCLHSVNPIACQENFAGYKKDISACFDIKKYLENNRCSDAFIKTKVSQTQTFTEIAVSTSQACIAKNIQHWQGDISLCDTISGEYWYKHCIENYLRSHNPSL